MDEAKIKSAVEYLKDSIMQLKYMEAEYPTIKEYAEERVHQEVLLDLATAYLSASEKMPEKNITHPTLCGCNACLHGFLCYQEYRNKIIDQAVLAHMKQIEELQDRIEHEKTVNSSLRKEIANYAKESSNP